MQMKAENAAELKPPLVVTGYMQQSNAANKYADDKIPLKTMKDTVRKRISSEQQQSYERGA